MRKVSGFVNKKIYKGLCMYKSLVLALSCLSLNAVVKINDQDINEFSQPGQIITVTLPGDNNHIALCWEGNCLSVGTTNYLSAPFLGGFYQLLLENKNKLHTFEAPISINFNAEQTINLSLCCFSSRLINLSASRIVLKNSIIKSPTCIKFHTDFCDFRNIFIKKSDCIEIRSKSSDALIQMISFKFNKNFPYVLLDGDIRLNDGYLSDYFIAFGAYKMKVVFHQDAYN